MKYYIDSGHLKAVVEAQSELDACAKALYLNVKSAKSIFDVCSFEQEFIVSQRGFVTLREQFEMEIPFEKVIDADDVLAHYGRNY